MNNTTKDQQTCDGICKKSCRLQSHERDLYRVCPSKLSKRELENLYFALLENNLEMKKTLHTQQDKIKVLSTKLQRMTVVQRNAAGKEKDCNCNSKIIVNQQKDIIADLKKDNDQMTDRIRLLNMRLCSAKQFLKHSSVQPVKCPRCGLCPVSVKNSSMSAIEARPSQTSIKMTTASCQYIPADNSEVPKSTRDVETETDQNEIDCTEKQCNENKCRSVMDELKHKIVNLQEELSKTHNEYSKRISKLESDVSNLHQENTRVRSSKAASDHALQQKEKKADDLREKLRETEGKLNDLKMQLTIERRKVKELETALKLSKTSSQVVKIMEKLNTPKAKPTLDVEQSGSASSYYSVTQAGSRALSPNSCGCKSDQKLDASPVSIKTTEDGKLSKSDDSGCTDLNKSSDADDSKALYMECLNREMLQKISDLQMQLDGYRIKAAGESVKTEKPMSSDENKFEYEDETQVAVITVADPAVVVEVEEQSVKAKDSKTGKDVDMSTLIKNTDAASFSSTIDPVMKTSSWNDLVKNMQTNSYKTEGDGTTSTNQSPDVDETKLLKSKRDEDLKQQIPGPIPTTFQTFKDKKKPFKINKTLHKGKSRKDINDLVHKKGACEGKCVKIDSSDNEASDSKSKDKQAKSDVKSGIAAVKENVEPSKSQNQKITFVDPKDEPVVDGSKKANEDNYILSMKDNNVPEDIKRVVTEGQHEKTSTEQLTDTKKESSYYSYQNDAILTPQPSVNSKEKSANDQMNKTGNEWTDKRTNEFVPVHPVDPYLCPTPEQCLPRARACRCPRAARRDLSVYRTCSGTLCFHTTTPDDKYRQCDCAACTDADAPVIASPKVQSTIVPTTTVPATPTSELLTIEPTNQQSTLQPAVQPTLQPAVQPTLQPAVQPTLQPAVQPTLQPAVQPTVQPILQPAVQPTLQPAVQPTFPQSALRRYSADVRASTIPPYRDTGAYTETSSRRDSATYTALPPRRDSATYTAMPPRRDSATYTAASARRDSATYTAMPARPDTGAAVKAGILNDCKCERATSSANTERDVSSLSDLPPEQAVEYPRAIPLPSPRELPSPGEQRATTTTTTSTDTDTRSFDYGPLSDGELPTNATLVARSRKLSFGEQPMYSHPMGVEGSSEAQMEATLNAISAELAHCRELLAAARDREVRWDRTS